MGEGGLPGAELRQQLAEGFFLSFTIYFSYQLFYQVFSWRKAALLTLLMLTTTPAMAETVAEVGVDLPFAVQRSFLIYNVPNAELRGDND